jgi:hypothetical protein
MKDSNGVAVLCKLPHNMQANKASSADDQNSHTAKIVKSRKYSSRASFGE